MPATAACSLKTWKENHLNGSHAFVVTPSGVSDSSHWNFSNNTLYSSTEKLPMLTSGVSHGLFGLFGRVMDYVRPSVHYSAKSRPSHGQAVYNMVLYHASRICSIDHGFILSPSHDHTIILRCLGQLNLMSFPCVHVSQREIFTG